MRTEKLSLEKFSSVAIMIFAVIFAIGQLWQAYVIFDSHSAANVSGLWMIATTFLVVASIIYGLGKGNRVMVWSGAVRALPATLVTAVYFWYGSSGLEERTLMMTTGILLFGMLFMPKWRVPIIAISMVLVLSLNLHQTYKIWVAKSPGKLSSIMLFCFTASTVFWLIHGWKKGDKIVFWFSLLSLIILVPTTGLWFWYRYH